MVRRRATPRLPALGTNGKTELDDIFSTRCHEDELIDNALRAFLNVTTSYRG
jgi:hypothetical protein